MKPNKKRHHYVPATYLRQFADPNGRVWAYRKDEPSQPLHVRPDEIAFENYYYSQPGEDGERDDRLEDHFAEYENLWPGFIGRMRDKRPLGEADKELLAVFMGMMRVRIPATRDMVELMLAEEVKARTRVMDRAGQLPPRPPGLDLDDIEVAIDPHQSLLAMPPLLQGFSRVLGAIGLQIVHNETDTPFLTSDNPVVYFDPDVPEDRLRPYVLDPKKMHAELFFPITSKLLIHGHSKHPRFMPMTYRHVALRSAPEVRRINRLTARFGYRFVFASTNLHGRVIEKHAAQSPAIVFSSVPAAEGGEYFFSQYEFRERPKKRKWPKATSNAGLGGSEPI